MGGNMKSKFELANETIDSLKLTLPKTDSSSPEEYVDAILLIKKISKESLPGNKYKLFRNYMTNELGISQDDIMTWTKNAVDERVNKYLKGIDLPDLVIRYAKDNLKSMLSDHTKTDGLLRDAIYKEVKESVRLNIEVKE
jgi:hydrogenase maturation factor HypE